MLFVTLAKLRGAVDEEFSRKSEKLLKEKTNELPKSYMFLKNYGLEGHA